jgi:hypothetical protein
MLLVNETNGTDTKNFTCLATITYSRGTITGNDFLILDSLTAAYPYHDFEYKSSIKIKNKFDHYNKWWDWFRTGSFQQSCKKKKTIKYNSKSNKIYWRRILPHKSGWVGKALQRRKGN